VNNLRGDRRLSEKEGARTAYSDDPSVGGCQVTNDGMEVNSVIMLTPDDQKLIAQAKNIFGELLHTETVYVDKLRCIRTIKERMIERIRGENHSNAQAMEKEIREALNPPGLASITTLHTETLLPQIQQENARDTPFMGAVLNDRRIAPFFKVYSEFLSRKETTCDAKVKRIQQDATYKDIYKWLIRDLIPQLTDIKVLNLDSLLLEPVQRLPRYELMLKSYVNKLSKLSSPHPDLKDACSALSQIEQINKINNIKKRKAEDNDMLAELASKVSGMDSYLDGRRSLMNRFMRPEAQVYRLTRVKKREGDARLTDILVFSDCVLIVCDTQSRTARKDREVKHCLKLDGLAMTLLEIPVPDQRNPAVMRSVPGLRISAITETIDLIVIDDTSQVRLSTIKEKIEKSVCQYESDQDTFRQTNSHHHTRRSECESRLGERAPRLMCTADVSMCATCWKGFGTFAMKCHCHACGAIVCSSCATNTDQLPYKRFDPVTDSYTGPKRAYSVCPHCAAILMPKQAKHQNQTRNAPFVEHFDDLWRQSRMQGWLGIRKADQSEFHKCWCAILPLNHARTDRVEYGFLFTARKAPCDSSPVFERPLIGFHLNQSKPQNSREWLLKLQKDKLNIMLDDKDSRDDWVNAIRSAIKISDDSFIPQNIQPYDTPVEQQMSPSSRVSSRAPFIRQVLPPPPTTPNAPLSSSSASTSSELTESSANRNQLYYGDSDQNEHFDSNDTSLSISKPVDTLFALPVKPIISELPVKKKAALRSKSMRIGASSTTRISSPIDHYDQYRAPHYSVSPGFHRHSIHHTALAAATLPSASSDRVFASNKLDKTSSGSIDNFQHLFKKTLSQEKLGETKSRFERGFNRLSSRFKMPKKLESFVKSSKTCSNEKPLSKTP